MQLTEEQIERIIESIERSAAAFDSIAHALAGINISTQKFQRRYAPEPRTKNDAKEAVVTRVPNDEDRAKENQGASDQPIREWFAIDEPEEEIGPREKEFLEKQRAEAEKERGSGSGSAEAAGSDAGKSVGDAADNTDVQGS